MDALSHPDQSHLQDNGETARILSNEALRTIGELFCAAASRLGPDEHTYDGFRQAVRQVGHERGSDQLARCLSEIPDAQLPNAVRVAVGSLATGKKRRSRRDKQD